MRSGLLRGTLLTVAGLAVAGAGVAAVLHVAVPARISDTCTVTLPGGEGATLDADQADNAALITALTVRRELPARAATIALATAVQESKLRNIDYGDRDSLGLFQQRPSQGWGSEAEVMDPVFATNAFLDVLVTVEDYRQIPVTDAAQRVQRSGFPLAYADHEPEGRAFASALTGHSPATLTCRLRPDDDAPDPATAVPERLAQDWGLTTAAADGVVVVDTTELDGDGERLGWAVAHWAVATAGVTGAERVAVDGQVWQRADGNDARWAPVDGAGAPPTGVVQIS
ncbi:hypothetical protein [Georgenia sunbinii]|uniref:hypothetical protein n=1 Tax=Georgenia sunbinii TaxID=3117728 RepID=UPI002F26A06B